MVNLLIVGYYHLADGFLTASQALQKDYTIYFFPLSHYLDRQYNISRELLPYLSGHSADHYECGLRQNDQPMDIILLWNVRYFMTPEGLALLVQCRQVHPKGIYLAFNWDPHPPKQPLDPNRVRLIEVLNGYLTCDGREIHLLFDEGYYNYLYCPAGFNPDVTHYIEDPKYQTDVSLVCTTLYDDPASNVFTRDSVRLHRKDLVDLLYQHRHEIKFCLYRATVVQKAVS